MCDRACTLVCLSSVLRWPPRRIQLIPYNWSNVLASREYVLPRQCGQAPMVQQAPQLAGSAEPLSHPPKLKLSCFSSDFDLLSLELKFAKHFISKFPAWGRFPKNNQRCVKLWPGRFRITLSPSFGWKGAESGPSGDRIEI